MLTAAAPVAAPQPDLEAALAYFNTLYAPGSLLHFRSVAEPKDGRPSGNHHYAVDEKFRRNLDEFLTYCHLDRRAAYVLPGTVTDGGTGKADVTSLPTVLVDLDKGDPAASLAAAEEMLGRATVVVESGGSTETGAKLHAYWRLQEPATGAAIGEVCRLREQLALQFGGDPAFKQAAQVIRIPGSIHFKEAPKLVKLRAVRPSAIYPLAGLLQSLGLSEKVPQSSDNGFDFDLNNVVPLRESHVDRVMTAPIRAEGKDDLTRFEGAGTAIGHFIRQIREGRMREDEAWEATRAWNLATLQPPWGEARLRTDFDRLVRIDLETHGPLAPAPVQAPEGWSLTDWRTKRFKGPAPARRWLVEGLIPAGTPGLFAAVGDAGKSMLALRLALVVSSYPAPTTTAESPAGFADTPNFFGQPILARGAAVILAAEDDADEIHRRLAALDPSELHARTDNLIVVPMLSTGGARAIIADGPQGPQPTPFWHELRAQLLAIPDLRLVVLDPLSSFTAGDTNDNRIGTALMTMVGELAATSGAVVMLVHHFGKGRDRQIKGLAGAREAIRGAGAFVDNGRWALTLWEADEGGASNCLTRIGQEERAKQAGIVYLGGLAKGNAPGAKTLRTFVRNGSTGLLEDVTGILKAATPRAEEVDAAVYEALRAEKMADARFDFTRSKNPLETAWNPVLRAARIKVPRGEIEAIFDRLLDSGRIVKTNAKRGGHAVYEPVTG